MSKVVSDGAKPEANSNSEKRMMSAISTGRRPKCSASQPNRNAPMGRAASVQKMATETASMSVPNSAAMAFSMKTIRKKSKASRVQPR